MKIRDIEIVHYYMTEGCPHFAIAIHNIFGYPIEILFDQDSNWENTEFPIIAHVYNVNKGKAVDAKGIRGPLTIKAEYHDLILPTREIISIDTLKSYMGDSKPLFDYSDTEIKEATEFILRNRSKYEIRSLNEAPLADYQPLGDFTKPGPFRGPDKKLIPHPVNQLKAAKFLQNTPYDFRLFFSNVPGTGRYSEYGPMAPDVVQRIFGNYAQQILQNSENAITIIFVGNKGDAKVPLTPWIMAHRFGHAIQAGVRMHNMSYNKQGSDGGWPDAEKHFFGTINRMLENLYGRASSAMRGRGESMNYDLTAEYNALFNAIGTQHSSRSNKIRRPYEFLYELFAQYLKDGKITLNPLPVNLGYGRQAWGNPTKYMYLNQEYRDEETRQNEAAYLADSLSEYFAEVLRDSVGKIYVM